MVEELAFLVKDNLPCKHLVLSMEDMLVDFLQDDTSLDEELELQPMNPYNRLLLHRLADIFGFSHQSIGEGDERHLVLKRCEDTSMPSILVSDMLWEHDEYQSPITSQLLSRREDGSPGTKVETLSLAHVSLEDREAAYLAARNRIFSTEDDDVASLDKNRPRNNPIVARRMIAHALGQRVKQSNQEGLKSQKGGQSQTVGPSLQLQTRPKSNGQSQTKIYSNKKVPQQNTENTLSSARKCENLKEEHIGAAKRMFAHALRMHNTKDNVVSKGTQIKQNDNLTP